jgi:ankyrin repeat protein
MRTALLSILTVFCLFSYAQPDCDSLVTAAGKLDLATVKRYVESGVSVNCKNSKGRYPFTAVLNEVRCKYRDNTEAFKILDFLIAAGADFNNPKLTPSGAALNYSVAGFSDLCLFEYLVSKGAKPESSLYTTLFNYSNHEQVLYMLRKGVPLPQEGWLADYIMIGNAASAGSDASVMPHLKDTLFSLKKDYEGFNYDGLQPIHAAVKTGDTVSLKKLIEAGVNLNEPDLFYGWTPLHYACYYHEADYSTHEAKRKAVKWLLERNVLLNEKTLEEFQESWTHAFNPNIPAAATPLDVALLCKKTSPEIVELLKRKVRKCMFSNKSLQV